MSEASISRELVERLETISYESLPGEVIDHAVALMLDTRMVALAGALQPDVAAIAAQVVKTGGTDGSPLWMSASKVPASEAAFVNALAASALDYDSLHANVHPDAIALASAWAVAWAERRSGQELMRAFVLGSELICRLSDSIEGPQKGWTIGAVLGTFGAAASAATLLRLTPEQTANALGLCLSMAAGSQQANVEQVLAKRLQPALAARAGVHAARLAQAGITAPAQVFEGRFGLWALYFPGDRHRLLQNFGIEFSMRRTGLKKYPVCACSHAAMDALRAVMVDHSVAPQAIEHIEAIISPFMARLVGAPFEPASNPQVTAQFSLQYALASIALWGRLGLRELATEAVLDPGVAAFVRRISITIDEANEGELAPAVVRLRVRSGACFERRVDCMPGSSRAELSSEERVAKYVDCAASFDDSQPAAVLDAMEAALDNALRATDVSTI